MFPADGPLILYFDPDLEKIITMMTSSNGYIFRVTGHLIPFPKSSNAELGCFLCAPEQTAEQTIEILVNWDAMALIITSL